MSENYLHLIPIDYNYVPSSEQIQRALSITSANPLESEPEVVMTDNVDFIFSGTNLEAVYCPQCRSEIDWEWWSDIMNRACKDGYRDLGLTTPCCGLETNLNELRYDWPSGFAKFRISFLGPRRDLAPAVVDRIAQALGTPLRKVWAHF